ncbi:flagellar hook assembly protein FlgD [Rhodothermus marinus]|uniref:Basal-body rod modification protein FlgD n=1 Tax=Rhodothermus marinus (strain ATCC 43812 / DSM 4252 / R-10) TaxID=518766 RepID=D0MGC4_RHOM4|nr:FlgD immunoglobulin-like domain containing protein [Rhodothermus marinus]ACY47680.1 flagellar hook capping protein [Rhodothermus marinus DSM 4252]
MPSLIAPIDEIRQQALQSTPSAPAPPSQELDKEAFLRLLVTQLRYQDPINPLDSREFAAQLAQFSTVEQLIGINETLAAQSDAYAALAQGIHNSVAAGLVGKVIEAEGDRLTWGGEDPVPFRIELGDAAQQVSIQIRNEAGEVVRTIFLGSKAAGEHAVEWDGKNDAGEALPAGTYTIEVLATDADGDPVAARSFVRGRVTRVTFGPEGILLWIGDRSVPMQSVRGVESE